MARMETRTVSIKKLFAPERRFLVPIFQRGYVWTRVGQWEPLWSDVVDQALVVRQELSKPSRHARKHFLGAIVIGEDQSRLLHVPSSAVIDGQQRLTTLQVLLIALRDAVEPLGDKGLSRHLVRLTDNEGEWPEPDERFKVWPTNAFQTDFRRLATARSASALKALYPQHRIRKKLLPQRPALVEAYLFFSERIDAYIKGSDEPTAPVPADATPSVERARELYEAVQEYLQLVTIELGRDDDPQVIFETLNARGVDLEPSDLVRNFVFLYATRNGEDPNDLYDRYWREFDETPSAGGGTQKWWRERERQGRLLRERLDLFCFHYVTYRLNREIKIGHLFQEFRDWWETGDAGPDESVATSTPVLRTASVELERMQRAGRDFRALLAPDCSTRFGLFASRVKRLDTTTVYPLLLWIAEHLETIEATELAAILGDLESFLVRRSVCNLTSKNYNQIFLTLLRKLRRAGPPTHATLRQEVASLRGESTLWPDDERFCMALITAPIYSTLGPAKTQMVLEALDAAVDDRRAERIVHSVLTVEHVLPQAADVDAWPYPVEVGPSAEKEQVANRLALRASLVHSVGNLTLLTQQLNSSVGRGPFAQKRPAITGTSRLALNAYFQSLKDSDLWDERSIVKRSRVLAEVACRIWPHPGSAT
jgi:hypothetical protein